MSLSLHRPERTVVAIAKWRGQVRQSLVLCGWCRKIMGTIEGARDSHGICSECAEKYFPDGAA